MPITNKEKWDEFVKANDDPYGGCCVNVARRVMEILDADPAPVTPQNVHNLVCKADKDIDAGGITGFMAGCVAQMVSTLHSRGEEFRKAWNGEYGHEGEGVVNPAIMNISVPEGMTVEKVITEVAEKAGMKVLSEDEVIEHFKPDPRRN